MPLCPIFALISAVPEINLNYPAPVRDTAKSGMGVRGNRHLHYFAESFLMNLGGLPQAELQIQHTEEELRRRLKLQIAGRDRSAHEQAPVDG